MGRGGFPHRYKPSSLLRLHIADTSALPMLELGLMPVVTTMGGCDRMVMLHIVTMMRMAMMVMRVVIISSLMGCGELGSW